MSYLIGPDSVDRFQAHNVVFSSPAGVEGIKVQSHNFKKRKVQEVVFPNWTFLCLYRKPNRVLWTKEMIVRWRVGHPQVVGEILCHI